jgi:hypothetical protein
MMLAVALLGLHLGLVCSNPALGLEGFELGLLPGVSVLVVVLFSILRHPHRAGPFAWGFVASLAMAIGAFLASCLTIPDVVRWPVVHYVNDMDPYILNSDYQEQYWLSLELQGLIYSAPQLFLAFCGGLAAKAVAGVRRN